MSWKYGGVEEEQAGESSLVCKHCDDDIEMTDVAGHYSGVCKKCRGYDKEIGT